MPILDSASMKTGSTAPKSPRHMCRGLTTSLVTEGRVQSALTAEPRDHVPMPAVNPQIS